MNILPLVRVPDTIIAELVASYEIRKSATTDALIMLLRTKASVRGATPLEVQLDVQELEAKNNG